MMRAVERIAATALVAALSAFLSAPATAQDTSSYGQSWSGFWGFGTATDRSVGIQQAQAINQAENGDPAVVQTYNSYYDNRANYVENNVEGGTVATDLQLGDDIGQQTYSVGALNTGNTTVTIEGSDNVISAVNSAETVGCVDGSINELTVDIATDPIAGGLANDPNQLPLLAITPSVSAQDGC
jgi:hypothetical protein